MGPTWRPAPCGDLGELQRRVLDDVARSLDRATRGGVDAPVPCDPAGTECVADGLRVLLASLPAVTGSATTASSVPVGPADAAVLLALAGEALDRVAEAARRAAVAFAVTGQDLAADIAESLMTVALALRMLVELGLRTPTRS